MRVKKANLFYTYYDVLFAKKDYAGETELVLNLSHRFGKHTPQHILEVGCGTGNHTIDIARRVKYVTAIDIDPHMIRKAREKIHATKANNIEILHTSIEKLKEGPFDLAIALFNVVTYILNSTDLCLFMVGIAKHLKPGGVFVFDCWNGIAALRDPPKSKITKIRHNGENITCLLNSKTDFFNQKVTLNYHLSVENGIKQKGDFSFTQTLWTPMQIKSAIEEAGMKVVKCFPHMFLNKIATERDWKIMFVCRRDG